jgi:hypothetical protein
LYFWGDEKEIKVNKRHAFFSFECEAFCLVFPCFSCKLIKPDATWNITSELLVMKFIKNKEKYFQFMQMQKINNKKCIKTAFSIQIKK